MTQEKKSSLNQSQTVQQLEEMGAGKLLELLVNQVGKGGQMVIGGGNAVKADNGGQAVSGGGDAVKADNGGQVVRGGGDAVQTEKGAGKSLEPEEIIKFIEKMQQMVQEFDLSDTLKAKCDRHLETVRDEVQGQNPDKEYAAKTLQKFTHILKETGKTIGSGVSLMDKLQPTISGVLPWLGEAKKFLVL